MHPKESVPRAKQWQRLYELSAALYYRAPWTELWDTNLIAVSDPLAEDDFLYCSVMGMNKEHFAVGAYLGARGFQGLRELYEKGAQFPQRTVDMLRHQDCVKVSFELPHEMRDTDLERAKQYGYIARGNRYPEFYSFCQRAGGIPARLLTQNQELYAIIVKALSPFGVAAEFVLSLPIMNDIWNDLDERFGRE